MTGSPVAVPYAHGIYVYLLRYIPIQKGLNRSGGGGGLMKLYRRTGFGGEGNTCTDHMTGGSQV